MKLDLFAGWLAAAAFYLAGILPAGGTFLPQLVALFLLIAFGLTIRATHSEDALKEQQKTLFWLLAVPCAFLSALNSAFYENYQLIAYSVLFALIMVAAKWVADRYPFDRLASLYLIACTLLILTLAAFDFGSIQRALSATQTNKGLFRLTPFGNHPNLAGHFFGVAAAILLARTLRIDSKPHYLVTIPLLLVFCIIILATSSRGTILALVITSLILFSITRRKERMHFGALAHRQTLFILGVIISISALLFWKSEYLLEILDINSSTRGINSGGTGRFQNWANFVEQMMDQPLVLFFGHGFRSWPLEEFGFDSDNSYIVLIYELGLPLTVLVTFLLIKTLIRAIQKFDSKKMSPELIGVLSFALLESVFSRYLISIGNPASFIILSAFLAVPATATASKKRMN